jgi:hypothetical protein
VAEPEGENAPKRPAQRGPSVRDPRVEFAKMLSRLGVSRESIKEEEEVIETPDEKTVMTYDLQLDPQTGTQRKVTKFSTTQRICELCDKYVPWVYKCENEECGAFVRAKHRRRTPYGDFYVCLTCYEQDMRIHEAA